MILKDIIQARDSGIDDAGEGLFAKKSIKQVSKQTNKQKRKQKTKTRKQEIKQVSKQTKNKSDWLQNCI